MGFYLKKKIQKNNISEINLSQPQSMKAFP
jgi:hypothetical protein